MNSSTRWKIGNDIINHSTLTTHISSFLQNILACFCKFNCVDSSRVFVAMSNTYLVLE